MSMSIFNIFIFFRLSFVQRFQGLDNTLSTYFVIEFHSIEMLYIFNKTLPPKNFYLQTKVF